MARAGSLILSLENRSRIPKLQLLLSSRRLGRTTGSVKFYSAADRRRTPKSTRRSELPDPCEQPVCSDRSECNWDYCGMADGDYAGGEGHGRSVLRGAECWQPRSGWLIHFAFRRGGHYARRQGSSVFSQCLGPKILTPSFSTGLHRQQRRLWSRGIRQRLGGNRSVERREPGPHPNALRPLRCTGQRFSSNFPSSKIERMYHNSATLVPDGCIFISGSNPNDDVSTRTYETRYTNDFFSRQSSF